MSSNSYAVYMRQLLVDANFFSILVSVQTEDFAIAFLIYTN